ncbi:MAG: hypothetical protein R3C03_13760 [Pirellulaceae bacterium]
MNIPPYDNKEYRFRETDSSARDGRERAASLLGLAEAPGSDGLQFDLSFFSGGIGVCDKHAIAMNADSTVWAAVIKHLSAMVPSELASDDGWSDEFIWLIAREELVRSLDESVVAFINEERRDFQDVCTSSDTVMFRNCSNVNDWAVIWGFQNRLNFLAFSQG